MRRLRCTCKASEWLSPLVETIFSSIIQRLPFPDLQTPAVGNIPILPAGLFGAATVENHNVYVSYCSLVAATLK